MPPYTPPDLSNLPAIADDLTDAMSDIEAAICDRLSGLSQVGIKVVALPDKVAQLSRPMPKGYVLVAYEKSQLSEPEGLGAMRQHEDQIFSVTTIVPSIHGTQGAYLILRLIRLLLTGFKPPHCCSKGWIKSQRFARIDPKNQIWEYITEFVAPTIVVEALESDSEILLRRLTLITPQDEILAEIE